MEGTYWLCKHDWRFRSNRNRPVSCSSSAVHRSITRQLALIPQRLIRCMRLIGYLQSLLSLAVARLQPTLPIRVLSSTSSRLCPDEHDGAAGYRQRVKHRQEAPSAQHFSLPVEKLAISRPNQVWCRDITYIPVENGFLYLVAIIDWAFHWFWTSGFWIR